MKYVHIISESPEGHKICQEFNEIEFHRQLVKLIHDGFTVMCVFTVRVRACAALHYLCEDKLDF